jgi:hypothetical protein
VACLGTHRMANFFHHFGHHHPDQDIIFNQKNGTVQQRYRLRPGMNPRRRSEAAQPATAGFTHQPSAALKRTARTCRLRAFVFGLSDLRFIVAVRILFDFKASVLSCRMHAPRAVFPPCGDLSALRGL